MSKLPWIILGKRYRYIPRSIPYIFVFTSYDENSKCYHFDYKYEESDVWGNNFWHSDILENYKNLFTLIDRPKIEEDPEYEGLFI